MTASPKPGLIGRWREWKKQRHHERLEAKARSHEALKNYKPPNENSHSGGA